MQKAPIEYRNPTTAATRADALLLRLRERHAVRAAGSLGKLLLGIPLCCLAPALLAAVIVAIELKWTRHPVLGFQWAFLALSALMIPLLFWYEKRTRGEYLSMSLREVGSTHDFSSPWRASSSGEMDLRNAAAGAVVYVELFLYGPRMVLEALQNRKLHAALTSQHFARAAEVLHALVETRDSIVVASLLRGGEARWEVNVAIALLIVDDWIGIAKDGSKVWLLSDARKFLTSET